MPFNIYEWGITVINEIIELEVYLPVHTPVTPANKAPVNELHKYINHVN